MTPLLHPHNRELHSPSRGCSQITVEPLISTLPPWWDLPPEVGRAAEEFDKRQETIYRRAQSLMADLERDSTSQRKVAMLGAIQNEARAARLLLPSHPPAPTSKPRRRRQEVGCPAGVKSIWAARAGVSDSASLFDSEECMKMIVTNEWMCATHVRNMDYFIQHVEGGEEGGVREVERVLLQHAQSILQV